MNFESFLAAGRPDPKVRRVRRRALALALAAHGVLLAAAVVHAGWKVDEISPPAVPITFNGAAPPPPPPAGERQAQRRAPRAKRPRIARELVQPVERQQPQEVEREESGPPTENPEPGEGEGGEGPPCNGPACMGPAGPPTTFVPPTIASGRLAIDPQDEPYRVKLPPALNRAGMRLWVLAKLCVRADGSVERVSLLRGADPALDPLVVTALQSWRYRPYAVNGRPVPFCTNVRYEIATQ